MNQYEVMEETFELGTGLYDPLIELYYVFNAAGEIEDTVMVHAVLTLNPAYIYGFKNTVLHIKED